VKMLVLALVVGATAALSPLVPGAPLAARTGKAVTVQAGDRVVVRGEQLGCRVARIAELGGRTVVDCRRAGPLAGTYGTMISRTEALIVRFRGGRTAQTVYTARHEGSGRPCG
jgi:hypothetical protein